MMTKKKVILAILSTMLFWCFGCDPIDIPVVGDIDGIVVDAETNEPIQGANVTLSPLNSSATTGVDGKYDFKNLDPKDYTIEVQKDGYTTNTKSVTVIAGQTNSGDVILQPIIPIINLSVSSLDFGNNLTTLPIAITNSGEGSLEWSISENAEWISINPLSGITTSQTSNVMVTVDRSSLESGSHSQIISIISNGGNSTVSVSIVK